MTRTEIRERLVACAEGLEKSIEGARERHARQNAQIPDFMSFPFEQATDINCRPLAADMYASLGNVYATLAHLIDP